MGRSQFGIKPSIILEEVGRLKVPDDLPVVVQSNSKLGGAGRVAPYNSAVEQMSKQELL